MNIIKVLILIGITALPYIILGSFIKEKFDFINKINLQPHME